MMEVQSPVSDRIQNMRKADGKFLFETDRGILSVTVLDRDLINVSFTVNGTFAISKPWIVETNSNRDCSFSEDESKFYINAGTVQAVIAKCDSSVSFYRNGKCIFAEDPSYPRQFEEVNELRIVNNESVVSEDIETADGVKKLIKKADKAKGRLLYRTRLHIKFDADEAIYGLGQSEEGVLNHRNTVRYLYQANRKISMPVIMSSKGYGLYFPTGSAAVFCDNEFGTYFQSEADEMMEYYFLGGQCLDNSIAMLRTLTGKAQMLPRWAFGYLQSKERYESEEEILQIADEFRNRRIGLDALILDWITWEDNMWGQKSLDAKRFPNPYDMLNKLHEKDIKLMISIWPNMTSACENHKEFAEKKLLFPGTEVYDALKPEARELYWKQVNEGLFKYGFDGWWCDSSEPFTPEWTKKIRPAESKAFYDFINEAAGVMPYDQINAYGFYHALGIYEGQREISDKRVMNLTRNGYPGSQRLGVVLWSGDISADYDTLKHQVAEGLNICASGMPYWTLDIGAFFVKNGAPWFWKGHYDNALDNNGYKELYVRWYQYGAFLPIFRSHGTDCPREPWRFGEQGSMFYDALLAANKLRYRLLPYIYSMAYKVWKNDYTMMRLLAFDFQNDENVANIKDQYMLGDALMVCPVLNPMYYDEEGQMLTTNKERSVYLPKGCDWYDLRDNSRYAGGQTVQVRADISSIPVFVKAGSILPMCSEVPESTAKLEKADVDLYIFGEEDSLFEIYSDDGDGYAYESGAFCLTKVCVDGKSKSIGITYEGYKRFATNINVMNWIR